MLCHISSYVVEQECVFLNGAVTSPQQQPLHHICSLQGKCELERECVCSSTCYMLSTKGVFEGYDLVLRGLVGCWGKELVTMLCR